MADLVDSWDKVVYETEPKTLSAQHKVDMLDRERAMHKQCLNDELTGYHCQLIQFFETAVNDRAFKPMKTLYTHWTCWNYAALIRPKWSYVGVFFITSTQMLLFVHETFELR